MSDKTPVRTKEQESKWLYPAIEKDVVVDTADAVNDRAFAEQFDKAGNVKPAK